jgi:hypothetical protein
MATFTDNTFEPGQYWIGDLCYVMHDEWREVCSVICKPDLDTAFAVELNDGRVFGVSFTQDGDGEYLDNLGNSYGVDAGLLGVIKLSDISERDQPNISLGHVHTFDDEFEISNDGEGMISIGHIDIDTGNHDEVYDDTFDDEFEIKGDHDNDY